MPIRPSLALRRALASALLVLAAVAAHVARATPTYQLTLWGTFRTDGTGNGYAFALNDSGATTGGLASDDGGLDIFVRTPAGVLRDKSALVATYDSYGMGINATGVVAGYGSTQSTGFAQGFRLPAGAATPTPLVRLAGGGDAVVSSVSDSGVAVGWGNASSGCGSPPCVGNPGHAVKWLPDGSTVLLPALGGYYSAATGISRNGSKICGYAANASGQARGFLLSTGDAIELPPLPGYDQSYAWGVNDAGLVAGHSEKSGTGEFRATLWSGGVPVDLGVLPGSTSSTAWHVANSGLVSGWLHTGTTNYLAATFSASGPPVDLNAHLAAGSAWTLRNAFDSNAGGQICGYADSANVSHAFLLTPQGTAGVAPSSPGAGLTLACASRNPGSGAAALAFTLPAAGRARLEILDVAGRRVARVAEEAFAAGTHVLAWDGRDDEGRAVGAGLYLARLVTNSGRATARLVRTP